MGSIASPIAAAQYNERGYIYNKNYFTSYVSTSPPAGPTGDFVDVVKSDGDSDFFARRATNVTNFSDMNSQAFITISPGSIPSLGLTQFNGLDIPLAPEKLYTLGADIPFLIPQINGVPSAGIAELLYPGSPEAVVLVNGVMFQGVKRFNGAPNTTASYNYREKPYTYVFQFTQNWTYLLAPFTTLQPASARTFYKNIENFDFELQALEFSADYNNDSYLGYPGYMLAFYDANGYRMMKDYVHFHFLTYNGGYSGAQTLGVPGNTQPWLPNCYPIPPVIYPVGSQIRVDILSLLDTRATSSPSIPQTINFRGVNRIPC